MTSPPETMSATPRATKAMPRVTMNEGTRSFAMIMPLMSPKRAATPRPPAKPSAIGRTSPRPDASVDDDDGAHDRREAHDPADREVDAARDDDERLAQAHEQDRDDRHQDGLGVAQRQEVESPSDVMLTLIPEERDEHEEEHPGPDPADRRGRAACADRWAGVRRPARRRRLASRVGALR